MVQQKFDGNNPRRFYRQFTVLSAHRLLHLLFDRLLLTPASQHVFDTIYLGAFDVAFAYILSGLDDVDQRSECRGATDPQVFEFVYKAGFRVARVSVRISHGGLYIIVVDGTSAL